MYKESNVNKILHKILTPPILITKAWHSYLKVQKIKEGGLAS